MNLHWQAGKEDGEVPPPSDPLDFQMCPLFFLETPGHQIGFPIADWFYSSNSAETEGNRLSSNGIKTP